MCAAGNAKGFGWAVGKRTARSSPILRPGSSSVSHPVVEGLAEIVHGQLLHGKEDERLGVLRGRGPRLTVHREA